MINNKTNQNEVKKKKVSRVRTSNVKDFSNIDKLKSDEFLERLLNKINEIYLGDKK
jgi:hypothetical protein